MQLTRRDGKFILEDTDARSRVNLAKWELVAPDTYSTKDFRAAEKFREYADYKAEKILNRVFVTKYSELNIKLPSFLDAHQKEGIKWVLSRSRSYLAHAPGAGKTCQVIVASLLSKRKGQTLFIVPPALTQNWVREIMLWAVHPDLCESSSSLWPSISVIPKSHDQVYTGWGSDFIICPDSMLTKDWVLEGLHERSFKFVGVDEASRFKDPSAERTRALFGGELKGRRYTPGFIYDAEHVVLLDGSPMPNRSMELWAPIFAMYPEAIDFMTQDEFGHKYCGATINNFGRWEFKHNSNSHELQKRLEPFMHVVGEEKLNHPERMRSLLYMNEDVRTLEIRKWEKENLSKIKFSEIGEGVSQGGIATVRKQLGIKKVKFIAEYVRDRIVTKDESVLLFVWHREVALLLDSLFLDISRGVIIGGVEVKSRELILDKFQSGKTKLIIANIAAMGRGFNLTRADRVVFGEFSWSDELNKQCEKRASRKGRDKDMPVRCEYVVCPNSMDEIVLKAVMRKAQAVKKVIG